MKLYLATALYSVLIISSLNGNNDSSLVEKYNNIAVKARNNGKVEQSIEYLQKSRSLCSTSNGLAWIYNALGVSYYKLSDYHTAKAYYDSAFSLKKAEASPLHLSYLYNNYGLVYMQLEDFTQAIVFFKKALQNISNNKKGWVYFNMAKCLGYAGKHGESEQYYRHTYTHNKSIEGMENYLTLLAGLELAEFDTNILCELNSPIKNLGNKQILGLFYSQTGDHEKAEIYLEDNKDQLLKYYAKSKQWYKAVAVIDTLRRSYLSLESKLFLQANEMLIYKNAVDSALKTDTSLALGYAQKSYGNILRDNSGYTFDTKQESLNYFDFDSVIYLFTLNSAGLKLHIIEADETFWENYSVFLSCFVFDSSFWADYYQNYLKLCTSGKYLFDKLVPKTWDDMLIVASGKLQFVPFECLPVRIPADTSLPYYKQIPYLMNQSTIHYDYILRDHRPHKGFKRITAFAPDTSLKYAVVEVQTLRIFNSKRLVGSEASKNNIYTGNILHIASHYDPDSLLLNFHDGGLHIDSLPKLPKDLVVLTTCQSGTGRFYAGEGILSPTRAFYGAGAGAVVESLWNAPDDVSYYIIWKFYKQLILGKDKATALRIAKQKYLEYCMPHLSHPLFWSNYRVFGNNHPIKIAPHPLVLISAAVFLVTLVLFIKQFFGRN